MTTTRYFIVPAPGHYGDRARVQSSHSTLALAWRAAIHGETVRRGEKRKGDEWLRCYEDIYAEVAR